MSKLTEDDLRAFAEVLAIMADAIKPDDADCPACRAHRAKDAARQRRYRARKAKKAKGMN